MDTYELLSAREIAARVRAGTKSWKDAVQYSLDRIAALEPGVSAWSWVHASAVDCISPAGVFGGSLVGVPFGVKDVLDVAGMPTRCGSIVGSEQAVAYDAACVAVLRAAGAIPVGKTVTAEFGFVTPGPTRNPWNTGHTPGGASSGSAAAVASGMVPLALGAQNGGSIIRSAAFCGVVGYKPTFGAIQRGGMRITCDSLDTIGWFTRDVADAELVGRVLLPWQNGEPPCGRPVRVAFMPAGHLGGLSEAAGLALASAVQALLDADVCVETVEAANEVDCLLQACMTIMCYELARNLRSTYQISGGALSHSLQETIRSGLAMKAGEYLNSRRQAYVIESVWRERFAGYDFILTPSAPGSAPEGFSSTGSPLFNLPWTLLGWPCVHLPTGFDDAGLPVGVQLVGLPGGDQQLLAQAGLVHGWLDRRASSLSCQMV